MSETIALTACPSYAEKDLNDALCDLTELTPELWAQIHSGMRVYIKANLLMPASADSAKTTHPMLIAAVAKEALRRGASAVVVGDSPGGLPYTGAYLKMVYESLGLPALAKKIGFTLNTDTAETQRSFPEGKVLRSLQLAKAPMDADLIINIGKCKTHGLTAYTGCVKNLYGMIPGSLKMELHARFPDIESFSQALIDIALCVKPQIHLLDAVTGMEGEGPSGGKPRFIGALLCGGNPFALDDAAARLIGYTAQDVPYLRLAKERNLYDDTYTVAGGSIQEMCVPDFVKPVSLTRPKDSSLSFLVRLSHKYMQMRVAVDTKKCVGCARCSKVCPQKAITMQNHKPVFDHKACARCFCCQELCPQSAVYVKRPLLSRLLHR